MIKSGAIVIDVGMHRIDGKVTGDLIIAVKLKAKREPIILRYLAASVP
jgi:5,10-methylene-tetrahydrofolate dehydrogenase/methenyl tetrahydrofolate cyclohydrolase